MLSMSRAGLAAVFLFLSFLVSVLSAPLSGRPRLVARYDQGGLTLYDRSSSVLFSREHDFDGLSLGKRNVVSVIADRDTDAEYSELFKREYDALMNQKSEIDGSGMHILYRRNIFSKIKHAFQHAFHKVGQAFKKVGSAIKKGFQKAGSAIKKGFQKAGAVMKKGFQKAGHAIKKGFQKVGHFIKTTGAKIAKFGLKIAAAAASVVSKVVKWIPGVGTAASMALKGVAKGASIASEKIHVSLGKKLDKVSHALDYVISPISTAAKAAGKKVGKGAVVADLLT